MEKSDSLSPHLSYLSLPGPSCWAAGGLRGPQRLQEQGQVPGLLLEGLVLEQERRHEEQQEEGEPQVELLEVEVVLRSEGQIWVEEKQILFVAF